MNVHCNERLFIAEERAFDSATMWASHCVNSTDEEKMHSTKRLIAYAHTRDIGQAVGIWMMAVEFEWKKFLARLKSGENHGEVEHKD